MSSFLSWSDRYLITIYCFLYQTHQQKFSLQYLRFCQQLSLCFYSQMVVYQQAAQRPWHQLLMAAVLGGGMSYVIATLVKVWKKSQQYCSNWSFSRVLTDDRVCSVLVNKLIWFTDYIVPTTRQTRTYHIPTTYIPTTHQPHTNHIPTTHQTCTHIPTTYQPHTDHIPTLHQTHTYHISTTHQPHTKHLCWPLTEQIKFFTTIIQDITANCHHLSQ